MRRTVVGALALFVLAAVLFLVPRYVRHARVELTDIGPRLVSNQTAQPLALYGKGFFPGMRLSFGAPLDRELKPTVLDATHAFLRLPGGLSAPANEIQETVPLSLEGKPSKVTLTLVNDAHFPDPLALALAADGAHALVISPTTDEGFLVETASGNVQRMALGDGPNAVVPWGPSGFAVAHRFAPELRLLDGNGSSRTVPAPSYAHALALDAAQHTAFVADDAQDSVTALDLKDGRVLWTAPVMPNPAALVIAGDLLAVGSHLAGTVELLSLSDGKLARTIQAKAGTPILGGHTEPYSAQVMNGKAVRALAYSAKAQRLFESSVGPNIGPNPQHMEVTMNGGVAVLDPARGTYERHVGMNAGVPEGLALDEGRGILYAADIALGLVRIYSRDALTGSNESARKALLGTVPLLPPDDFPRFRPDADLGGKRAGVELYSGPKALALSPDAKTLYVLNRFTGLLVQLDVTEAGAGKASVRAQWKLTEMLEQPSRRDGEILYFADVGKSAMSCDTCHLEGHAEGMLFEKTHPNRIYRSPTIRDARETPPYFTPASTHSLAETMKVVGDRNRFHNPDLTRHEINDLTVYGAAVTVLPNPNLGADGAPKETLTLPDGKTGRPRVGMALFEGKAQCQSCHPGPHFTLDQSTTTRGRFLDVGTPLLFALREPLQDPGQKTFGIPSLLGAWDVFPMLDTGSAGLHAVADGSVEVSNRFVLRELLEKYSGPKHGNAQALSEQERDDLLAYLLSL